MQHNYPNLYVKQPARASSPIATPEIVLTDLSAAERFEALGGGLGGPDSRAGLLGDVGAVGGDVGHDDGGVNRSLFKTTPTSSMLGESGRETIILGML